jgi:molybdate transport system substrate-binding protein
MKTVVRGFVFAAAVIGLAGPAGAAEVHALITTAMKEAADQLAPAFGRKTANTVAVSYGPSGGIVRRFLGGEPADLIIIDSGLLDDLINRSKVQPGRTDLARTAIGICVKKGAPRLDVSTPEALKRALLAANTIGYASPASGGITVGAITRMFERLGIAAAVAPKTKLAAGGPNGRVSVLVSSGQAEIGLQQVSELMSNPGVDVIGMLPAPLQQITTYSAGITTSAKEPSAARGLIEFLATPAATALYKTEGLGL